MKWRNRAGDSRSSSAGKAPVENRATPRTRSNQMNGASRSRSRLSDDPRSQWVYSGWDLLILVRAVVRSEKV